MQNVHSYNLATGNKWILSIPHKVIDKTTKRSDLVMNLFKFEPPEFSMGYLPFYIQGIEFPIPTNNRNEKKELTIKYIPSADYHQFKFLYAWFNTLSEEDGFPKTINHLEVSGPITVTFISQYKTPIYSITYHDAWISGIEKFEMDYQNGDEIVTHGFTLRYSHYTVDGLIEKEDCP